jgi:hypothetical protein
VTSFRFAVRWSCTDGTHPHQVVVFDRSDGIRSGNWPTIHRTISLNGMTGPAVLYPRFNTQPAPVATLVGRVDLRNARKLADCTAHETYVRLQPGG